MRCFHSLTNNALSSQALMFLSVEGFEAVFSIINEPKQRH